MDLLVVLVHLRRVIHRAEFRSAHGAEGSFLVEVVGKSFVVHRARGLGIERERELLLPIELVAGIAESVVAVTGAGTSAGNVSSVRGNLVSNDAVLYVFLIRQAKMLFRCDVAEHGGAVPADHGCADRGSDVVVTRSDVGNEGA